MAALHSPAQRPICWPELLLYGVVVSLAVIKLFYNSFVLSRLYETTGRLMGTFRLYQGWIPGLENDLSDIQWRLYRVALPKLVAILTAYATISRLLSRKLKGTIQFSIPHHAFRLLAGVFLIIGLHGSFSIHVLCSLAMHYLACSHAAGVEYLGPLAAWGVPAVIWIAARTTDGLPFGTLFSNAGMLDKFAGPVRWQTGFNLVMLRMISWGMDLHWMRMKRRGFPVPSGSSALTPQSWPVPSATPLAPKERQNCHHAEQWYEAHIFFTYCLYPPLYLTGPTINFNDFACQLRQASVPPVRQLGMYAARLLLALLLTEVLTHCLYVNAFARFQLWHSLPQEESHVLFDGPTMASMAFWKLLFLWLKFLVIWRVARLFALVDGIDPPENMLRCVCNNYDISGFWRTWHASFNKWLIRYLYIPAGGARTRLFNVWPIFTFVALWHDLEWHLLKWAWLMAFFIAPEVLCKALIRRPAWRKHWQSPWFVRLCAAGSSGYITVMMAVNLVGYGLGQAGVQDTLGRMLDSWHTSASMLVTFFAAANLMFENRRLTGEL